MSKVSIPGAITLSYIDLLANTAGNDTWIIGGGNLISQCWDMIDEVYLTKTFTEYTCDTFIDLLYLEQNFMCWFSEQHADHTYQIWKRK
jgi:dihydrofolate reductase